MNRVYALILHLVSKETTTPTKNAPSIYSPTPSASATKRIINAKIALIPICVVPPIKRCKISYA